MAAARPPHYDDVLREVSSRLGASGSVGKGDIATLAFWKRIRTDAWAESLLSLLDRGQSSRDNRPGRRGRQTVGCHRCRQASEGVVSRTARLQEGLSDGVSGPDCD